MYADRIEMCIALRGGASRKIPLLISLYGEASPGRWRALYLNMTSVLGICHWPACISLGSVIQKLSFRELTFIEKVPAAICVSYTVTIVQGKWSTLA